MTGTTILIESGSQHTKLSCAVGKGVMTSFGGDGGARRSPECIHWTNRIGLGSRHHAGGSSRSGLQLACVHYCAVLYAAAWVGDGIVLCSSKLKLGCTAYEKRFKFFFAFPTSLPATRHT